MTSSKTMGHLWFTALVAPALIVATAGLAEARSRRPAAKPAEKTQTDPMTPMLVGTYGDWSAYTTQGGKSRVCYVLAQPKDRSPSSLKKVAAHIFISSRPAEHVHNEISVIFGVPLKPGDAQARAEVGTTSFDMVSKGQNAFVKNAADEVRFIDLMKKSPKLIVKGTLIKGGQASDSYSLTGLGQALDRVTKECQ